MAKLTMELRAGSGVTFREGHFTGGDVRAQELATSLEALCTGAKRTFGRLAEVLEAERTTRLAEARAAGRATTLPDLNAFFDVDGEAAALAAHELVASAVIEPKRVLPPHATIPPIGSDVKAHDRDARGQGMCVATMGAIGDLKRLAPEAELDIVPVLGSLGDAIDRATANLADGDVLLVPFALDTPSARAAAAHAVARGVAVVVSGGKPLAGALTTADAVGASLLAGRLACVQSYAVGVGLGRLAPADAWELVAAGDVGQALDTIDARAAARPNEHPRLKVVLEEAQIIVNGDVGAAEIYFEGWVDDGAGGRRAFRIPHEGHVPGVNNGQTIPLNTEVFASKTPVGAALRVHVEAWDEDLGRNSLVDPDDLLGVHEQSYAQAEKWGEGQHAQLRCKTDAGEWLLTYRVEKILQ